MELCVHSDHRPCDLLPQISLRCLLHLLQDEGRDLGRAVVLALGLDPGIGVVLDDLVRHQPHVLLGHGIVEAPADEALDGEEGVLGIGHRLALGRLADETRSEEHTSELQSLMRISYAVFCLKKKKMRYKNKI